MMITQEEMQKFLVERTGIYPSQHMTCFGKVRDGKLVGVVGFDKYNKASIEMHVAFEDKYSTSRELLTATLEYPFQVCGCKVVLAIVSGGNPRVIDLAKHLGFKTEAVIEGGCPDGALHILSLRKEDHLLEKRRHQNGQS